MHGGCTCCVGCYGQRRSVFYEQSIGRGLQQGGVARLSIHSTDTMQEPKVKQPAVTTGCIHVSMMLYTLDCSHAVVSHNLSWAWLAEEGL